MTARLAGRDGRDETISNQRVSTRLAVDDDAGPASAAMFVCLRAATGAKWIQLTIAGGGVGCARS